jgi:hypothetical protein
LPEPGSPVSRKTTGLRSGHAEDFNRLSKASLSLDPPMRLV